MAEKKARKPPKPKVVKPLMMDGREVGWKFGPLPSMSAPVIRLGPMGKEGEKQVFYARTFPTPGAEKVDVCRVGEYKAGCVTEDGGKISFPKGMVAGDKADYCAAKGGIFTEKKTKELRRGKTEVEFISPKQAASYGLGDRSMGILRMCWAPKARGLVVPVESPEDARDLAHKFERECGNASDVRACAEGLVGGRKTALAGRMRRSRR